MKIPKTLPKPYKISNQIHQNPLYIISKAQFFPQFSRKPLSYDPNFSSNSKYLHTTTTTTTASAVTPPPEWVQPFTDLSDLITTDTKNLQTSPWVPQILTLLQQSSPSTMEHNLDSFCHKVLIRLSPSFITFVLKSDQLSKQSETAFRFFNWASKQTGYTHTLECYVSIIELLCNAYDLDKVKYVFTEFKEKNLLSTSVSSNSLIRSLGSVGLVDELLWVWKKMKENEIEPSLYTYNFLLNGLVNSTFIESAERVFEVMESGTHKINPDIVTYNTMIKGYCKTGKVKKAMEKFREMEVKNVGPDKITYMMLIQACYAEENFDYCLGFYQEMMEKGINIPPHAYSLVIGGLCKKGKSLEAYTVFENMVSNGIKINVAIYTSLIDLQVKNSNLEEAMRLFDRMCKEGLKPDEVTYGVIINGLCKNERLNEALEWFKYCKENNVLVNGMFYSSLINGLGKNGRINEAETLFNEMVCVKDSYCYNALIDAFIKNEKLDEALLLFIRMEQEGINQTVYTYTILINGLFKARKNEEALIYWDLMIDKGISPNEASFRVLSKGLCLSGKVARACKILDDLAPMGIIIETGYEDMINVLCKANRVNEACKLADGIVDRGREIPGKIRTILINGLRKSGNVDLAMKMMHSKIGIGYDRMGSVKKRVKFRVLLED